MQGGAGQAQQDMLAMMAQMRDAVAFAAQAAQTSAQALQEVRSSMTDPPQGAGLKGTDLTRILSRPDRFARCIESRGRTQFMAFLELDGGAVFGGIGPWV